MEQTPGLDIQAIAAALTPEQEQQILDAAASVSAYTTGQAPESMTLEQAIQTIITAGNTINDVTGQRLDRIEADLNTARAIVEKAAQDPQEAIKEQEAPEATITIDTAGYDPKLDPNSPEFDIQAYTAALDAAGDIAATLQGATQGMQKTLAEAFAEAAPTAAAAAAEITAAARAALRGVINFLESDSYKAIKSSIALLNEYWQTHREEIAAIAEAVTEAHSLAPFLEAEIEADPDLAGMTLTEAFTVGFDDDGNVIDSPFRAAIERAMQKRANFEALEQAEEELLKIHYEPTTQLTTTTTRLANVFYALSAPKPKGEIEGQRQMTAVMYEGKKSKIEIPLLYDYSYNEDTLEKYGLDKQFSDFEFLVAMVCDNLLEAGNDTFTLNKIFTELGGRSNATNEQLTPILKAILKGMSTMMHIDDYEVLKAWNKAPDAKYHEFISPVIPAIIGNERFIANGKLANGYVKMTDHTPFWRVAAPLGQVTSWDKEILRLYTGKKTPRYWSVLRYLMTQIAWMRKGKRSHKILYSTLYSYTGDKTTRAQQLARDMMYRLLDEVFIPAEYVAAYKEEATPNPGVVITLHRKRLQGKKK